MAEIERIAQELRALHQRPLPATQEQVQALVKLAERDRPLTLNVNSQAVATLLAEGVAGGLDRPPHELLSERELQVFLRLAKGETITQDTSTLENPAILDQLGENN